MTSPEDPPGGDRPLSGRLPFCEDGRLDPDQAALARQLHELAVPFAQRAGFAGTDEQGRLIGPWNILVARPGPAAGFNQWVLAEQTTTSLDPRLREVAMLTVAVARQADYAIYSHRAAARTAGVSETAIAALLDARTNGDGLSDSERVVHRFSDQLARHNRVEEDVYAAAMDSLGQSGVLDLTHLVGVYLGTCALLGAFAVPAPGDAGQDVGEHGVGVG